MSLSRAVTWLPIEVRTLSIEARSRLALDGVKSTGVGDAMIPTANPKVKRTETWLLNFIFKFEKIVRENLVN